MDSRGEAILMISNHFGSTQEQQIAYSLLTSAIEPLQSALKDAMGGGIEKLLLDLICSGRLSSERNLIQFMRCTLLAQQYPEEEVLKTSFVSTIRFSFNCY